MAGVKKCAAIVVLGLVSGCHLFDDPETLEECPLNSGYPCPCTPGVNDSRCDDGSSCEFFGDHEKGVCSKSCIPGGRANECLAPRWYDTPGLCQLATGGSAEPNGCVVTCEDQEDCPPGLSCMAQPAPSGQLQALCYPVEMETADPCITLCNRIMVCYDSSKVEFTRGECLDWCVNDDWKNDPCLSCWLDCEMDAPCGEFSKCLNDCNCQA